MNDTIKQIKEALEIWYKSRGYEYNTVDTHIKASAVGWLEYLIEELDRTNISLSFWKEAAETQKDNNLLLLGRLKSLNAEHTTMKAALEWYAADEVYTIPYIVCEAIIMMDKGDKARSVLASINKEDAK